MGESSIDMPGAKMKRARSDDGFILIEAMLAIVILAVVGLSLMRMTQMAQKSTLRMREVLCSQWVAENQAAMLSILPFRDNEFSRSGDEVMCTSTWHWEIIRKDSGDLRMDNAEIQVFLNGQSKIKNEIIIPK